MHSKGSWLEPAAGAMPAAAPKASGATPGDRAAAIRAAAAGIAAGDFTKGGKPEVKAIEAACGFATNRAEIDAALGGA
jgi:hypothetical protein